MAARTHTHTDARVRRRRRRRRRHTRTQALKTHSSRARARKHAGGRFRELRPTVTGPGPAFGRRPGPRAWPVRPTNESWGVPGAPPCRLVCVWGGGGKPAHVQSRPVGRLNKEVEEPPSISPSLSISLSLPLTFSLSPSLSLSLSAPLPPSLFHRAIMAGSRRPAPDRHRRGCKWLGWAGGRLGSGPALAQQRHSQCDSEHWQRPGGTPRQSPGPRPPPPQSVFKAPAATPQSPHDSPVNEYGFGEVWLYEIPNRHE